MKMMVQAQVLHGDGTGRRMGRGVTARPLACGLYRFSMFVFLLSEPLPPSITTLLADRAKVQGHFKSHPARWRVSHRRLPFLFKDSPSASFYRIHQFLVLDMNTQLRNELEYFCTVHSDWSVADLPDPTDTHDPGRYAALAALTYLLCEAFNRRVELGLPRDTPPIVEDWEELARRPKVLEHVPTWATNVR